jgi:hypothetical protein
VLLQTHLQGQALAGGLTSGMWGCVIPSASPRATTRRPGGQSIASSAGGCVEGCPPGRRAVGRCQADGMTHELQRGLAEQTRSERPTSARHVPALLILHLRGASQLGPIRRSGSVQLRSNRAEQALSRI